MQFLYQMINVSALLLDEAGDATDQWRDQ